MHKTDPARYHFGNVELDIRGRRVQVAGQPCPLEPKSFDLLKFLVENRGRAIGKDEIAAAVWPETFVTDNSLTRAVTKIRKALRDDSREPKYIETLPTVGYRFTAACTAGGEEPNPPKSVPAEFISVAVLPVANRTGDADMEYLAEGFTDGAIRLLSEIPKLKLIARSTVYRFKIATEDALSFSRSLGVNVVLTGELKRQGNQVVFDAELTDVDEGTIILSRQYLPNPSDWMDIQADLALDVVRGLNLDLERGHSARISHHPTVSSEAYQSYLRGEFLSRRLTPASLNHALTMFGEAVRLDDRFALAWAETAQAHVVLGLYFERSTVHMPAAKEAANRALELDDSLQGAHAALAIIHLAYEWDYAAAERELASAAVSRHAIISFSCAAHLFAQTGRGRDAEGQIRKTLTFDPRNPALVSELGCNNYYQCRYEQAIDHFRDAKELDSQAPYAYWGMGRAYGQMKRYGEALAIMRQFKERAGFEPPILTAEIGYVLALSGCPREALEIVRQLEDTSRTMYVNPYLISLVWLGIGDLDQTFAWLEKAYQEKSTFVISIPSEPKWQPVRNDPRFQSVLERIGFSAR